MWPFVWVSREDGARSMWRNVHTLDGFLCGRCEIGSTSVLHRWFGEFVAAHGRIYCMAVFTHFDSLSEMCFSDPIMSVYCKVAAPSRKSRYALCAFILLMKSGLEHQQTHVPLVKN